MSAQFLACNRLACQADVNLHLLSPCATGVPDWSTDPSSHVCGPSCAHARSTGDPSCDLASDNGEEPAADVSATSTSAVKEGSDNGEEPAPDVSATSTSKRQGGL
jgi:hypothetical protein